MLSMAVVSAVGTFYESLYNAEYAKLVVYQSFWMVGVQILLAVNLIAVMVDRLPWKERHLPFLLAHVGIVLLLLGSVQTYYQGVDGVMMIPIGGSSQFVRISDKEFNLYSSIDGNKFETIIAEPANYFKNSPKKNEIVYNKGAYSEVRIKDHYLFAEAKGNVLESDNSSDGPALRFFIEGSRAKEAGWLIANKINKVSSRMMGLAELSLFYEKPSESEIKGKNSILFFPDEKDLETVHYVLFNTSGKKEGSLKIGDILDTGWMDFKLRVLNYKRHAFEGVQYTKIDTPHDLSTEAINLDFMGQNYWLGLDQPVKVFKEDRVFILTFGKKRVSIGFNLKLKKFKADMYQGTMRASAYQSLVQVEGKDHLISMNEPLKKNGLTFYQSSFRNNELGQPTHSILSVNKDPGRFLKYFGCLLIGLGTLALFYMRKKGHKWRFFK